MPRRSLLLVAALTGCGGVPAPSSAPVVELGAGVPIAPVVELPATSSPGDCPADHWPKAFIDPSVVAPSADDPLAGRFSMADAMKGVTGTGPVRATIVTSYGDLECELFADRAPITVANFVGLARGTRPWKSPDGRWVRRPAYDRTIFHRVIKGFMIQGGDAKGDGTGEPGYAIPDEIWDGAKHDRRGLLCTANRGRNTNGAQFFITDGVTAHLDGQYTIFGSCSPDSVIEAIANVPVNRDRPVTPVEIRKVRIHRAKPCPE